MSLWRHFVARLTEPRQLVFGGQMADPQPSLPQDMPHIFLINYYLFFSWVLFGSCQTFFGSVAITGDHRTFRRFSPSFMLHLDVNVCWFYEPLNKKGDPHSRILPELS